jgi:DAK2 domain fusion protein YloV
MITRQAFRANENQVVDGLLIKELFGAGMAWLETNRDHVNQLNVFPVPDGDTGTNMWHTMRAAHREVLKLEDNHVGRLANAIALGALKGARGNSGVILSQILTGTARALDGHEKLTAPLLAEACRSAVDAAYKAVEKPVEGTILTVTKAMADAVLERYEREPDLVRLLKRMLFAGRSTLRRTPDMLPVLRKAGVVDSGGAGLVYIFEGMARALCGKNVNIAAVAPDPEATVYADPATWQEALVPEDEMGYGYDVQFLMRGDGLNIAKVREDIQAMGWSTLVVGDNALIKVHVHVHNPGEPLSYAIGQGAALDDIVVENMQAQYQSYIEAREARQSEPRQDVAGVAVVTVASGDGLHRIFSEQFGAAHIITGGQTMNPSIGDFMSAIEALPNSEIVLLPNNKNVMLAARQAADNAPAGKRVTVVPSITIPQGISAMFEYINLCGGGECTLDEVADAMKSALSGVTTAEITNATRDADFDDVHVRSGQFIGLINDVLACAADDIRRATIDVLHKAGAADSERITLYYGRDVQAAQAQGMADALKSLFTTQEFEVVSGGQPLYPYIIGIE